MLWPHRSSSQARLLCFQLLRDSPGPGRDHPRAPRLFVCRQVAEAPAAPSIDGRGNPASGLREDSAPTLAPVRAWAGTTPTGSPARRCRTPSSDWPRRRASHSKSWEPAATRGDSALALRAPRPPGQGWVARRPPVPKGRLDNHRPAPCSCYTPALPLWCSRPCPAPGHDAPANPALSGQHCGPFCVRRRRARATAVGGVARARLRTSPGPRSPGSSAAGWSGKRRLPAERRSHPAVTQDPRGAPSPRCPCPPVSAEGPARGRLHRRLMPWPIPQPRGSAAPRLWPISL